MTIRNIVYSGILMYRVNDPFFVYDSLVEREVRAKKKTFGHTCLAKFAKASQRICKFNSYYGILGSLSE